MNRIEGDYLLSMAVMLDPNFNHGKTLFNGPRNFMILPNCLPSLTQRGTGLSGFTAIFAENRQENAILGEWYKSGTNRKIHGGSELVDAIPGQYGKDDNFYVITSDIKAQGFRGLTQQIHPQCKFRDINRAPEDFVKLKDK